MIITRTPLRISIGGGGTDLPSYYREFGGYVISAAISKYVFISVNETFFPGYLLKYSEMELAHSYEEIRHKLIRHALINNAMPPKLEVVSVADVPAGTGLGSSGSFLVGLLHALHAHKREHVSSETLACEAIDIEMNQLKEPVGKQDQYIAAYGGLLCQRYKEDDTVQVEPLRMSIDGVREMRDSLMLFFVGYTRSASELLKDQKVKSEERNVDMLNNLHFVKGLAHEIKSALENGDVHRFGELMHEHWLRKRARSTGMSNDRIDQLYDLARTRGGATGGKLVGAGGSGFLLFHTNDPRRLRSVMAEAGVAELDFNFDFEGSILLVRS